MKGISDIPQVLLNNLEQQRKETILLEMRAFQSSFGISLFNKRQEALLVNLLESKSYKEAYTSAGYTRKDLPQIEKFLSNSDIAKIIFYFKEKKENKLNITREKLSDMAMECYTERLTSSEGIRAIEVLSKLWGLNKETLGSRITINNQQSNFSTEKANSEKYIKTLSTEELTKLASDSITSVRVSKPKDKE